MDIVAFVFDLYCVMGPVLTQFICGHVSLN